MIPSAEVFWREDVGMWWPVADQNPSAAYEYVIKRVADSEAAVKACRKRRTCVQAGGYIGFWPMRLATSFARVLAFEVMPGCLEACRRNCEALANVEVSGLGLGAEDGETLPLMPKGTAGSWRLDPQGSLSAQMTTIDALGLTDCDLIVLDIEGHEIEALKGAAETIARCRPVIHVEERKENRHLLPAHLKALGYRELARINADTVYAPA